MSLFLGNPEEEKMDAWHRPKKLKTSIIRNVLVECQLHEVGIRIFCVFVCGIFGTIVVL